MGEKCALKLEICGLGIRTLRKGSKEWMGDLGALQEKKGRTHVCSSTRLEDAELNLELNLSSSTGNRGSTWIGGLGLFPDVLAQHEAPGDPCPPPTTRCPLPAARCPLLPSGGGELCRREFFGAPKFCTSSEKRRRRLSLQQLSFDLLIPHRRPSIPLLSVFLRASFTMPAAVRTIAPFLRTARLSLRQNQNPLVSLQRQSRTPLNFARTYAGVYERSKPHVNIGTHPPPLFCHPSRFDS